MRNIQPGPIKPIQNHDLATVANVLTGVILVGALYWAREVLIPLALAVLITFVLAPMALGLRRIGIPRAPAAIAVVIFSFGIILGVGALGASQIAQLAENLPQYQLNIRDKIRAIKGSATSSGAVSRATAVIENIGREISDGKQPSSMPTTPRLDQPGGAPIPVEIRPSNSNPLKVATEFLGAILSPLASTGLVILFVIFFLLQREDLRDRVIRLLGTKELHRTTEAMEEAASRLSRYFLLQTALNAGFGAMIGLGLWIIGVPSPLLWGIFAMLMRFVPYIGSILAAVLPVALAAAVDPGWTMVAWTVALFLIGEPLMGQVLEPLVFGHQTGLSPVAIVMAATFWTWLWGPIGLIVATPLTLCLVLLGQYTKRLEFLHVLLGDQPALTPPESFYQRLIAGDPAEIIDQAELQLKDRCLVEYYDDVALQGLVLAQLDADSGELPPERQTLLVDGVMELIDGLSEHEDVTPDAQGDAQGAAEPAAGDAGAEAAAGAGEVQLKRDAETKSDSLRPVTVLCVPGRGAVDHAAAALLVQLLDRAGIGARHGGESGTIGLTQLRDAHPDVALICVSYVATARSVQVRFMVRRLRRLFPTAKVLVGLWRLPSSDPEIQRIKDDSRCDLLAMSFQEGVDVCLDAAGVAIANDRASGRVSRDATMRPRAVSDAAGSHQNELAVISQER